MLKSNDIWRCRRIALRLTQMELSTRANVPIKSVVSWENGLWVDSRDVNHIKEALREATEAQTKREHCLMRILENAMELQLAYDANDRDEIYKLLGHIMIEAGQVQMDMVKYG